MPLVRKSSRGDGGPPAKKPRTHRHKNCYHYLDKIGYVDDQHHALFRSLPDDIKEAIAHVGRNVVSLLNANGGIIAYGVRPNGVIHGEDISRREQDVLNHTTIDETVKRIIPMVGVDMYRLNYTDVVGVPEPKKRRHRLNNTDVVDPETRRQVLEIRVAPGRPYQIYEDHNHEVFQRRKGRIFGPLTPHEIKDITVKQFKQELRDKGELMAQILECTTQPADHKTSAATKQPAKSNSSVSTKQPASRSTSVSIKRPTKGSTSSKPEVVIDLTGENDKTGGKSSSSSRPALKELNGNVGKTRSAGSGKKTADTSKETGKENTRATSKEGVEVAANGGKGSIAQDAMKPGEGHKTLVNRAIGSWTRSGRSLRAPPPEGKGETRASSSGESDQEAPLPNLAKVAHISAKPATKMVAAAVASAKSAVAAKPGQCGTKPTAAAKSSTSAASSSASKPSNSTAGGISTSTSLTTSAAPATKSQRSSKFDVKPTPTSVASTAIPSSSATTKKSSLPVARVAPQPSAAEPTKQAPAVAKPVPPKTASAKPVLPKPTPAVTKPPVDKPASFKPAPKPSSIIKPKVSSTSKAHYPSSGTHNQSKRPLTWKAATHSSLPPPPPPPSYSYPYPTGSQLHPYWNTSSYPGAAYSYPSQPQMQGRGQNMSQPLPLLRSTVQYPWQYGQSIDYNHGAMRKQGFQ